MEQELGVIVDSMDMLGRCLEHLDGEDVYLKNAAEAYSRIDSALIRMLWADIRSALSTGGGTDGSQD